VLLVLGVVYTIRCWHHLGLTGAGPNATQTAGDAVVPALVRRFKFGEGAALSNI